MSPTPSRRACLQMTASGEASLISGVWPLVGHPAQVRPHTCGQCSLRSEARCNKEEDMKGGIWEGDVLGEVGRGEEELMA